MDRDLVEKLLAAQVLTLATALKGAWLTKHPGSSSTSDFVPDAIKLVREKQADIIRDLLAVPGNG